MKVLLTIHGFFPRYYHGTQRYTLDLAKSLQLMGCSVVIFTADYNGHSVDQMLTEYVYENVRVLALDMRLLGGSGFRFQYERPQLDEIFRRVLSEEKPDLVHCCHIMHLGATIIDLAKEARLPVVCSLTDFYGVCWTTKLMTFQGMPCDGPSPDGSNCIADFYIGALMRSFGRFGNIARVLGPFVPHFFWMMLERFSSSSLGQKFDLPAEDIRLRKERLFTHYQQVDVFLTASDSVKDTYTAHGFPANRFRKIPFGVSQPDESEKIALEQRYGEVQRSLPLVFGFIGQVTSHKGVDLLVKAFQRAQLPNAELHIYGDLNQEREAKNSILKAKDTEPRIKCQGTFCGREIYQKLSSIHVLCLPSRWPENAPLVLLNGLASKTILIVAREKGLVEFVSDSASGFVFETNSLDSLTFTLRQVYEQRNCFLEMSRNMPGYMMTTEIYGQQVYQIYNKLLNYSRRV